MGWGVCDIGLQPAFLSFCFQEHLLCTLNPFLCRSGSISRGFRGEFKNWQITPGYCEMSPVMANQFSVSPGVELVTLLLYLKILPTRGSW